MLFIKNLKNDPKNLLCIRVTNPPVQLQGFSNEGQADEAFKQMQESARTRSRAESRQRMREVFITSSLA